MPIYATRKCACGCGETVTGARPWLRGHNTAAIRNRIQAGWGDELGFIEWFDREHPDWQKEGQDQ